jgi:hypothetical protein
MDAKTEVGTDYVEWTQDCAQALGIILSNAQRKNISLIEAAADWYEGPRSREVQSYTLPILAALLGVKVETLAEINPRLAA